jgi:hypothetical protein
MGHYSMKFHSPAWLGAPSFINAPKKVDFPRKRCVFSLEMMGFFLQYDIGIVKNVFMVSRGFDT